MIKLYGDYIEEAEKTLALAKAHETKALALLYAAVVEITRAIRALEAKQDEDKHAIR